MDNTELHYLTYDPEEIWIDIATAYAGAGGDILYPGDEKEMLLRSVQSVVVQVFAGVDNALRMQTLRYATGEYLDVLGQMRGCERIEAQPATATVTIESNVTGRLDTVPVTLLMTADGRQFYHLTEPLTLTGYQQTSTVEIVAERAGEAGNSLQSGAQLQLQASHPGIRSIVAATDAAGGTEREEDEVYRQRIRLHGLASVTTGPARQYEDAARAVSSQIVDARALKTSAGNVGVYLLISGESGHAGIVAAVQAALSAEDVRPLTDNVTVQEATDIPYTLNVEIQLDNASGVSDAVAQAVTDYQDWQDGTIGLAFNPDRLMAALYQAGATRVIWGEGSEFGDGGEVEYTEIAQSARCKGTITLTTSAS